MIIESYDLEIEVSNHSVEEFEYEAIARLPVDIAPVLPYLNATLRNGTYFPDAPAFSWREGSHNIGFWADRIAVDNLDSRDQAQETIERLVKLVNDTWGEAWRNRAGRDHPRESPTVGALSSPPQDELQRVWRTLVLQLCPQACRRAGETGGLHAIAS